MNELWTMFQRGAAAGAWVVGAATVMAVALPAFGILMALIAWVMRLGRKNDE